MKPSQKLIEGFTLTDYEMGYVNPSNSLLSSMVNNRKQYVLRELRQVSHNDAILEIGCAFGGILREVIDAGYHNLYACDISEDSLEKAKIYVPEVSIDLCSVEKLVYLDQSKDVVICVGVINYVQNPTKALAETFRILGRNGLLINSFGNTWSSGRGIVQFGRIVKPRNFAKQQYKYYTALQGKKMLQHAGFTIERRYFSFHPLPFEYRWSPDSKMGRLIEWARNLLLKLFGTWGGNEVVLICRKAI
jgi:ubiquinone/menaquinone biosynthesis C-methylase UbiE